MPLHYSSLRYLRRKDPALRKHAWLVAQLAPKSITPEEAFARVFDDAPDIRPLALEVLAWNAHPQLLDHCRRAAAKPTPDTLPELHMLATLATPAAPQDGETILAIIRNKTLALNRYALAGTLGRAEAIETLFEGMESPTPLEAQSAGYAYRRITGYALRIDHRTVLPPFDGHTPTEQEKPFLAQADIPDLDDAKRHWQDIKVNFTAGRRYSGGIDITETPADWREVDMQARWEYNLRNAHYSQPHLPPVELEKSPLRLAPDPATAKPAADKQAREPESLAMQYLRKRKHNNYAHEMPKN